MIIPSTKTTFGYLGLVVIDVVFITHDTNGFNAPFNPGLNIDHARGAGAEAITETNRQHRILPEDYALYHKVDSGLKGILLAAVPLIYVQTL